MTKDLEKSENAIPIMSAIIERNNNGESEILIQTRVAEYDKEYYGTIEIPAGRIEAFENVYDAILREVKEETGLDVIDVFPKKDVDSGSETFVFKSFCCQQMVKGNIPWIGFVFLCKVKEGKVIPQEGETQDIKWINLTDLRDMIINSPEKFFALQLPVLKYYLDYKQLK